jgi:hypothetical protein
MEAKLCEASQDQLPMVGSRVSAASLVLESENNDLSNEYVDERPLYRCRAHLQKDGQ